MSPHGASGYDCNCVHLPIHQLAAQLGIRLELVLLQFARLESLLTQAGRSPGRQTWTQVGEDQVRAATGVHQRSLTKPFVCASLLAAFAILRRNFEQLRILLWCKPVKASMLAMFCKTPCWCDSIATLC